MTRRLALSGYGVWKTGPRYEQGSPDLYERKRRQRVRPHEGVYVAPDRTELVGQLLRRAGLPGRPA